MLVIFRFTNYNYVMSFSTISTIIGIELKSKTVMRVFARFCRYHSNKCNKYNSRNKYNTINSNNNSNNRNNNWCTRIRQRVIRYRVLHQQWTLWLRLRAWLVKGQRRTLVYAMDVRIPLLRIANGKTSIAATSAWLVIAGMSLPRGYLRIKIRSKIFRPLNKDRSC